jgi:hypothetical protein
MSFFWLQLLAALSGGYTVCQNSTSDFSKSLSSFPATNLLSAALNHTAIHNLEIDSTGIYGTAYMDHTLLQPSPVEYSMIYKADFSGNLLHYRHIDGNIVINTLRLSKDFKGLYFLVIAPSDF